MNNGIHVVHRHVYVYISCGLVLNWYPDYPHLFYSSLAFFSSLSLSPLFSTGGMAWFKDWCITSKDKEINVTTGPE